MRSRNLGQHIDRLSGDCPARDSGCYQMTLVGTLGFSRNDELDQERALTAVARGEELSELLQRLGVRRLHPHAGSETDPVQRRIFEVE
jgi:hypothetical protein